MRQLQDIAKRLKIAVAASALKIADIRRAGHRPEINDVVADVQVPLGIAGMQDKAFRHVRQLRLDDVPPEPHHLRLLVDERAATRENLTRRSASDLKPRLFENPERGAQNLFHLFGAQDFQWRPAIDEPRQGRKRRTRGTRGAAPPSRRRQGVLVSLMPSISRQAGARIRLLSASTRRFVR